MINQLAIDFSKSYSDRVVRVAENEYKEIILQTDVQEIVRYSQHTVVGDNGHVVMWPCLKPDLCPCEIVGDTMKTFTRSLVICKTNGIQDRREMLMVMNDSQFRQLNTLSEYNGGHIAGAIIGIHRIGSGLSTKYKLTFVNQLATKPRYPYSVVQNALDNFGSADDVVSQLIAIEKWSDANIHEYARRKIFKY